MNGLVYIDIEVFLKSMHYNVITCALSSVLLANFFINTKDKIPAKMWYFLCVLSKKILISTLSTNVELFVYLEIIICLHFIRIFIIFVEKNVDK